MFPYWAKICFNSCSCMLAGMLDKCRVCDGGNMLLKFFDPGFLNRCSGELTKSFVRPLSGWPSLGIWTCVCLDGNTRIGLLRNLQRSRFCSAVDACWEFVNCMRALSFLLNSILTRCTSPYTPNNVNRASGVANSSLRFDISRTEPIISENPIYNHDLRKQMLTRFVLKISILWVIWIRFKFCGYWKKKFVIYFSQN